MKLETLTWAAQQFRDLAPRWTKEALPVYVALGMGTGGVLVDGEYAEKPVPTERELLDWFLQAADDFEGANMQRLAQDPERKDEIRVMCHQVLFSAQEYEGRRGCSVCLVLNSNSISG